MQIIYNKGWNLISFTENLNLNEIIIYFQGKYIEQTLYSYNKFQKIFNYNFFLCYINEINNYFINNIFNLFMYAI